MTQWYEVFDSMFFLGAAGLLVGIVSLSCKYCYKCKITDYSFCFNCLQFHREVSLENIANDTDSGDTIPPPTFPVTQFQNRRI
jgi:hypothetical protein